MVKEEGERGGEGISRQPGLVVVKGNKEGGRGGGCMHQHQLAACNEWGGAGMAENEVAAWGGKGICWRRRQYQWSVSPESQLTTHLLAMVIEDDAAAHGAQHGPHSCQQSACNSMHSAHL